MPDWLFSCNTIIFQKYFCCSQFSRFDCNIYYSCKLFRRFRLAPIPRLILHNQLALPIFRKMRAIYHPINGIFAWKRGWSMVYLPGRLLGQQWTKKNGVHGYQRRSSWIFDYNWTKEIQEYAKHIARWVLSIVWGVSARKKTSVWYPKLCRERGQSFKESLRGGSIIVISSHAPSCA